MKTLCLIRHAKSNWAHPGQDDIERPLDERGIDDANIMADMLLENKIKPDAIIASVAERAKQTAEIVADEIKFSKDKILLEKEAYNAGVEELLALIQTLDDKYKTVIFVGHNPGLTMLANYLAEDHVKHLPTCGTYCIEFNTDKWEDITTAESKTILVDYPKNHPEHD